MNTINQMNKIVLRKVATLCVVLLSFFTAKAQVVFPVQVNANVNVPSTFLSEYKSPGNFRIQVTQTDGTAGNLDVTLKMTMTSDKGTSLSTPNGVLLSISGGQTIVLSQAELNTLLDDLSGSLAVNGTLPEGVYSISFEVTTGSGQVISNSVTDFTQVLVRLSDPPLLTFPFNGEEFEVKTDVNPSINFTWTPRHIVFGDQEVFYEITFKDLIPVDQNPYQAMLNSRNLFQSGALQTGLKQPQFFYDGSGFPFQQGHVYAWQVQAYELINNERTSSRFKNQGYSDVFVYRGKENCMDVVLEDPQAIADPNNAGKEVILLDWSENDSHQLYELKYKPLGTVLPWSVKQIESPESQILLTEDDIETGTTYEYTVAPRCINWRPTAYGKPFQLNKPECEAPKPIYIESNTGNVISLKWDEISNATSYLLTYKKTPEGEPQEQNITNASFTLPELTAGQYEVKIDAICPPDLTAEGDVVVIPFDATGVLGDCPQAKPLNFRAVVSPLDKTMTRLSWDGLEAHSYYSVSYALQGETSSLITLSTNDALPTLEVAGVLPNKLYEYQVTSHCSTDQSVTSSPGLFRVEAYDPTLPIIPGTADCFPPSILSAEPKSTTTARFEWNKVEGADEYLLIYYPKQRKEGETLGDGDDEIVLEQLTSEQLEEQSFLTTGKNQKIRDLVEYGEYNYKVRSRCGASYSIDSDVGYVDLRKGPNNDDCETVQEVSIGTVAENELIIQWPYTSSSNYTGFTVRYKTTTQDWADAYLSNILDISTIDEARYANGVLEHNIDKLRSGTTYDFEVIGRCGTSEAEATDVIQGTTKEVDAPDCSSAGACDKSSQMNLSPELALPGTVDIADYTVTLTSLDQPQTGADERTYYKGVGTTKMQVPGLSDLVDFEVTFSNAFVNEDNCVANDDVILNVGVKVGQDIIPAEVKDKINGLVDTYEKYSDAFDDIANKTNEVLEFTESMNNLAGGFATGGTQAEFEAKYGNMSIDEMLVAMGDLATEIYDLEQKQNKTLAEIQDIFTLGAELAWLATKTGKELGDAVKETLDYASEDFHVTFESTEDEKYYFDALEYEEWKDNYKYIFLGDASGEGVSKLDALDAAVSDGSVTDKTPYYLPYKLLEESNGDVVVAKLTNNLTDADHSSISISNVKFRIKGTDVDLASTVSNGKATITLPDGLTGNEQVYAYYGDATDEKRIGKFLIRTYAKKEFKIRVIATESMASGLTKEQLEAQLNTVFNKVAVDFEVQLEVFDAPENKVVFSDPEHEVMSSFTTEMKALREAYSATQTDLPKDEALVFLIDGFESTGLRGYMPRNRSMGFIVKDDILDNKTFAHEIGHGLFALEHTFPHEEHDDHEEPTGPADPDADAVSLGNPFNGPLKETTNNLMDYTVTKNGQPAIQLVQPQWRRIHSNLPVFTFLDDEDDGKRYGSPGYYDKCNMFLTNRGDFIRLPESMWEVPIIFKFDNGSQLYGAILDYTILDEDGSIIETRSGLSLILVWDLIEKGRLSFVDISTLFEMGMIEEDNSLYDFVSYFDNSDGVSPIYEDGVLSYHPLTYINGVTKTHQDVYVSYKGEDYETGSCGTPDSGEECEEYDVSSDSQLFLKRTSSFNLEEIDNSYKPVYYHVELVNQELFMRRSGEKFMIHHVSGSKCEEAGSKYFFNNGTSSSLNSSSGSGPSSPLTSNSVSDLSNSEVDLITSKTIEANPDILFTYIKNDKSYTFNTETKKVTSELRSFWGSDFEAKLDLTYSNDENFVYSSVIKSSLTTNRISEIELKIARITGDGIIIGEDDNDPSNSELTATEEVKLANLVGSGTGLSKDQVLFKKGDKFYKVDDNGDVVEDTGFNETDFDKGNWTDSNDKKFVFKTTSTGVVQVDKMRFKNTTKINSQYTETTLKEVADGLSAAMNEKLSEMNLKDPSKTPKELGDMMGTDQAFLTGESAKINLDANTIALLIEGVDHLKHLLGEAEFKNTLYKGFEDIQEGDSRNIILPGIATAPTEYLAEKVTDFTSIGTMFYKMMFNKEEKIEQNEAMNSMNENENGVVEDQGSSFFSTVGTLALGMVSLDQKKIDVIKNDPKLTQSESHHIVIKTACSLVDVSKMISSAANGVAKMSKNGFADLKPSALKAKAINKIEGFKDLAVELKRKVSLLKENTRNIITGKGLNADDLKDLDELAELADDIPSTSTSKLDDAVKTFGCFVAGTPILTSRGHKAIETIEVNDSVWTRNDKTNERELKVVKNLKRKLFTTLLYLKITSGVVFGTTADHPFFVEGEYIEAGKLEKGAVLTSFDGQHLTVDSLWRKDTIVTVYNFEVAQNHNYFIGEQNVLVHNNDRCILKEIKNSNFRDKYLSITPKSKRRQFLEDCKGPDGDFKLFDEINGVNGAKARPDLVDSWRFLDEAGVDDAIRKNIDALADPDAALDAIQASGKAKPTWPEIQALFKRGNDYNAKARIKYGANKSEIVLKGVNGKAGKRLDTYIPPSGGKAGEIISRKATTLSEIQPNTFKNYLNELITKYPKGAELNSSKFPAGTKLDGDYFLEIPTLNKSFFESSTVFQKVLSDFNTAKGVDIKIKYLAE